VRVPEDFSVIILAVANTLAAQGEQLQKGDWIITGAATKPAAVAISASAIPGATPPMLAEPWTPITRNECMIPQTVPNKPIKGAVLPVVARKSNRCPSFSIS